MLETDNLNREVEETAKVDSAQQEQGFTNETTVTSPTNQVDNQCPVVAPSTSANPVVDTVVAPSSVKTCNSQLIDAAQQYYQIKWINWHGAKTPILTQNENGPCPLLAVMNVLLLRGQVRIPDDVELITGQQLMTHLGDCILRLSSQNIPENKQQDYEQNVSDAMGVLSKMMTGLDVNVRFSGISDFEYTSECIVFDLLNIPLYHGWLTQSDEPDLQKAVGSCSYNQLVEKIVVGKGSDNPQVLAESMLAEQFLECSASQLTEAGLVALKSGVKEAELAVLFRNNHFSTLYKHQDELFLLVTDQGFLSEPKVIWETLSNTVGDSHFVDTEFQRVPPKLPADELSHVALGQGPQDEQQQIDHDYMIALSLEQMQTDQAVDAATAGPFSNSDMDHQLAMQLQEEEQRLAAAEQQAAATAQQAGAAGSSSGQQQQPRSGIEVENRGKKGGKDGTASVKDQKAVTPTVSKDQNTDSKAVADAKKADAAKPAQSGEPGKPVVAKDPMVSPKADKQSKPATASVPKEKDSSKQATPSVMAKGTSKAQAETAVKKAEDPVSPTTNKEATSDAPTASRRYSSSDDNYSLSGSDSDDEGPPPMIQIEKSSDISALKTAFTTVKEKDSADKQEQQIEGVGKEALKGITSAFESKPADFKAEPRENLTIVDREKYSKYKNKFEHLDAEQEEEAKRARRISTEIQGAGKEKLNEAKGMFENPTEEFVPKDRKVDIERSAADKKRVQKTFKEVRFTKAKEMENDLCKQQHTFQKPSEKEEPKECAICGKTVYPTEKLRAEKRVFHKSCFKCCKCQKTLTVLNYTAYKGDLYCKPHIIEVFQPGLLHPEDVDPDVLRQIEAGQQAEAEEQDDDEEYALVTKPKVLGSKVAKSGLKSTDDLDNLPSLSNTKSRWETTAAEDAQKVERRTQIEGDMFEQGKVKARLSKFVEEKHDEEESQESDDDGRNPDVVRETRRKNRETLNVEVGSIKSKWETGAVETAQGVDKENRSQELDEVKRGTNVRERFKERTGDEAATQANRKSVMDEENLDFKSAGSARERFQKGSEAFQTTKTEERRLSEDMKFNELMAFKERFERGALTEGDEKFLAKAKIDVRCLELGNLKAAFEQAKQQEAGDEQAQDEKRARLEREFKRYKKEKRRQEEKERLELEQNQPEFPVKIVPYKDPEDVRQCAEMTNIKQRFEEGKAFKSEEKEGKRDEQVEMKVAGKARQKFKKIDEELPKDKGEATAKRHESSKWTKEGPAVAPEPINRRATQSDTDDEEDNFEVKNLLSKFKNIEQGETPQDQKGPKPKRAITPPPADYRSELESQAKERDPNVITGARGEENISYRTDAKNLKTRFEKHLFSEQENETADERRKRLEAEFNMYKDLKEREKQAEPEEEELPMPPENFLDKEELGISAEHAQKMRAKWEKIQRREAKKAQKSTGVRKSTHTAKTPDAEYCFSCGQKVYATEKMECDGRFLHRMCFRCAECHVGLRIETSALGPDGVYCKRHHIERFNNITRPLFDGRSRELLTPVNG